MKCPECKSDHINKNGHRDAPNQLGTEITLTCPEPSRRVARIALHLLYSDLTTPDFLLYLLPKTETVKE